MGRTTDLIDAVLADLQVNVAGWPTGYSTFPYAEPLAVTPKTCPLLAVYARRLPRAILATDHLYERKPIVEVAWYTSSTLGAETGGAGDPDQAKALINMLEAIGDRCELYADGIPALTDPGHYATVTAVEIEEHTGMVWKGTVTLEVWQA